jgi:hypothetical protein
VRSSKEEIIQAKREQLAWRQGRQSLCVAYAVVTSLAWGLLGEHRAAITVSAAALGALCIRSLRERVIAFIRSNRARRQSQLALLQAMGSKAPFLLEHHPSEVGAELLVSVYPGGNREEIERQASSIAAAMHAQVVRVRPEKKDASQARLIVVYRDRLERTIGIDEFMAVLPRTSLHHPVPLGYDEDGAVVSIPLFGHHLLIGGEPGSGKSVTLSVILAAAAFDPTVELWLLDGKLVELSLWEGVASRFVGSDVAEAAGALEELTKLMDDRYKSIKARRRRTVEPGDGYRLVMVVLDELAYYVNHPDRKAAEAFTKALRDVVMRGRAAGVIVVAATQKPSTEIIPSGLRDNFSFRLAHRCSTRDASDTILGSGWAAKDFSADSIDSAMRGTGYLLAERGLPRRIRTFWLTDFDVTTIVRHGEALRRGEGR